jgi:hypothetical protein
MSMKRLHLDMISRTNDDGINSLPLAQAEDISVHVTPSPSYSNAFHFLNRFRTNNPNPLAGQAEHHHQHHSTNSPSDRSDGSHWSSDTIKL